MGNGFDLMAQNVQSTFVSVYGVRLYMFQWICNNGWNYYPCPHDKKEKINLDQWHEDVKVNRFME